MLSIVLKTQSLTKVSILSLPLAPKISIIFLGKSSSFKIPALIESSISWFTYAILSANLTTCPSKVPATLLTFEKPLWFNIPSKTSLVKLRPNPFFSIFFATLTLCSLCLNPPGRKSFKTSSPIWAKAACPKSWPKAIASIKYSFNDRATPIVLATWETSKVWTSLVL